MPIKPQKKKVVKLEKDKKVITKKYKDASKEKGQKKDKHAVGCVNLCTYLVNNIILSTNLADLEDKQQ